MTDMRGRGFSDLVAGLNAGQHLAVDALVAFVDGELGPVARDRAAAHLTVCPSCAAEVAEQCQARSVVRSAQCPPVPADLLAALRDIPHTADLPNAPAGLAVTAEATRLLGSDQRWGTGPSILGRWIRR
jgi:anti-sigma factor RsiW